MIFWKLSVEDASWERGRLGFDQKRQIHLTRGGHGFQVEQRVETGVSVTTASTGVGELSDL